MSAQLPLITDVAREAGLVLERQGAEYVTRCPVPGHADAKTPSCFLNPDKNVFHCFGCGADGGVLAFAKLVGVGLQHAAVKSTPSTTKPVVQSRSSLVDAEAVWTRLQLIDRAGKAALNHRGLGAAADKDLVRFNTGKLEDPLLDQLARQGFRIVAPCFNPAGEIARLVLRNIERNAARRFHVVGRGGPSLFGRAAMGSDVLRDPKWQGRVLLVEGMADYLAAQLVAWEMSEQIAVLGVRSARDFDEALLAELFAEFKGEVYLYGQNDAAGAAFVSKAAGLLRVIGAKHFVVEPLSSEPGADLAGVFEEAEDVWEVGRLLGSALRAALRAGPPAPVALPSTAATESEEKEVLDESEPNLPGWVDPGGLDGPAFVAGSNTALVSVSLLEAVAAEVDASTNRLREAKKAQGGGRRGVERSPQSAALLALKLDTLLRVMSRDRLAFPSVPFLRKRLGVGRKHLHRQQVYAAESWLRDHDIKRSDRDPTLKGNFREWSISRPRSLTEAHELYVPIPAMAVLWLSPYAFLILCHLHFFAEQTRGGALKDVRESIIPLRAFVGLPAAQIAKVFPGGLRRVLRAFDELSAWNLLQLRPLLLKPAAGLKSPLRLLRRDLDDASIIESRRQPWDVEEGEADDA